MNNGTTNKEFPPMPKECTIMEHGKGTETEVQNALNALHTCAYCFSFMEAPQNNLFKFLKYLHISEAFNAHSLRILRQLIKTASTDNEKATFLKTCSLLQANVHLYALMQDKQTNVFKFLDSVKTASTNTEKAMKYLTHLLQIEP